MPLCKDCNQTLEGHGLNHHDAKWPKVVRYTSGETRKTNPGLVGKIQVPEHLDRCCDCTDEIFGMPAKNRKRPKPSSEGL